MSAWNARRLADLTTKIGSGATPRGGKGVYQDDGTAFIRSQNVYDLRFDHDGLAHISDQAAEALKGVTVNRGDVLVNITGESVTRTCMVDDVALPARVSQHVAIIRAKSAVLHPTFLLYSLINPPTKVRLDSLSQAGATRRALTKGHLESLEIPIPPLEEQERIADVLRAFDDLIETNRRLIGSVLDLTRAVYVAASRRATSMVPLGEFVSANPEKRSVGAADATLEYLDIGAMSDGSIGDPTPMTWESAPSRARRGAAYGDVLWATVRPNRRAHGLLMREIEDLVVSTGVAVLRSNNLPKSLVFAHTDNPRYVDALIGRVDGSAYPAVKPRDFLAVHIPNLAPDDIALFRDGLDPLWRAVGELEREVAALTRQRDELLPLLMSGQVRVRAVEAAVS